ncbi:AAA family ATPase [Myxococcota bacterium]|nr:AAA family ATPase [Myxococcota bacterium]
MSAPLRLKRLTIRTPFGPGSATIDIPFRLEERVTVLFGRNGSGKTITLDLLSALRDGRYGDLIRIPFGEIVLETDDGGTLRLHRRGADGDEEAAVELKYSLSVPGHEMVNGSLELPGGRELAIEQLLASQVPLGLVQRLKSGRWRDRIRGDTPSTIEVVRRYATRFISDFDFAREWAEPESIRDFRQSLPAITYIRTDRLFVDRESEERNERAQAQQKRTMLMVEHLSEKLAAVIRESDRKYRQLSTELDASLPKRLFDAVEEPPTIGDLQAQSLALRETESRLRKIGLLKDSAAHPDETKLSEEQRGTFHVILRDREQKLAAFAQIADKAERLLESLNRKLHPKTVSINVDSGYKVRTADARDLRLDQLSSGEQHEMVLLHELLFEAAPNTMVLIDEPELSLHVTWQQDFLEEVAAIARLSSLDFVLATHSPYIVPESLVAVMVRLGEAP